MQENISKHTTKQIRGIQLGKQSIKKLLLISLVVGTSLSNCKATTNNNSQLGAIRGAVVGGKVGAVVGAVVGIGIVGTRVIKIRAKGERVGGRSRSSRSSNSIRSRRSSSRRIIRSRNRSNTRRSIRRIIRSSKNGN